MLIIKIRKYTLKLYNYFQWLLFSLVLMVLLRKLCVISDIFFFNFQNPLQKLVKRMTRLFVTLSLEESMRELTSVLGKYSLEWKINSPYCVSIDLLPTRWIGLGDCQLPVLFIFQNVIIVKLTSIVWFKECSCYRIYFITT